MFKLGSCISLLIVLISFTACSYKNNPIPATVSITNLEGNSGGSGVILRSYESESFILTNRHVCEVVKNGGYVHTDTYKILVVDYRESQAHDLCLIRVMGDLNINTPVAKEQPKMYEKATVYGHPKLLPTIISSGNYSDKEVGTVMVGVHPCTPQDFQLYPLECTLFGEAPDLRIYEMQVIGALIEPGSSGSGVYDEQGELTNLIFASGSSSLDYGLAVPFRFLKQFLDKELATLPVISANMVR